jgi:hypothetical protein
MAVPDSIVAVAVDLHAPHLAERADHEGREP